MHRNPSLYAFSDADWAKNLDDRASTTAYVIFLGGNSISWSSRKQRYVARSSTEVEYRAIATTAAELAWIQSLLTELQFPLQCTPVIYCDNIDTNYVCANPVSHEAYYY